jgi:O-antigen ligase
MKIKNINFNKTIEYLFYLLIFLLPWQTRWIYHYGQLNGGTWEYGTFSLFGTEILLWTIFLLSFFIKKKHGAEKEARLPRWKSGFHAAIILFATYSLISIFWSLDKQLASYYVLHIIEALILVYLIFKINFNYKKLFYVIFASAFVQASLGVWQFANQFVAGNKWFGMASQHPSTLGVSVVGTEWRRWLRIYGAFSHPNVLAGFLSVGFLAGLYFVIKNAFETKKDLYEKIAVLLASLIIFLAILFTFSRASWVSLFFVVFLCSLIVFTKKERRSKKNLKLFFMYCLLLTFLIVSVFKDPFLRRFGVVEDKLETKSTTERISYYQDSWDLIKKNPVFGVGAGNYTLAIHDTLDPNARWWIYQPVHNFFVLVFVELGAIGFLLLLFILYQLILKINFELRRDIIFRKETGEIEIKTEKANNINFFLFYSFILILLLGLFDHYLWTSYFGVMLFWFVIGLVAKSGEE